MAEEQQNQEQQEQQQEKTFTQAELDAIVGRRVAKATKGMPSAEELAAFQAWKTSQRTEQQRMNTLTQERDTAVTNLAAAQAQIEQFQRERYVLSKGVSAEDADYYVFKAAKLVSDTKTFEQAADEVIQTRKPTGTARVDLGGSLAGSNKESTPNDVMNALIRGAGK